MFKNLLKIIKTKQNRKICIFYFNKAHYNIKNYFILFRKTQSKEK